MNRAEEKINEAINAWAESILDFWASNPTIQVYSTANPLQRLLSSSDIKLQIAVIQKLAWLGQKAAVEPLIELLDAKDSRIRSQAVCELGQLADERVLPLLKLVQRMDSGYSALTNPPGRTVGDDAEFAIRWIEKQMRFDRLKGVPTGRTRPLNKLAEWFKRIERRAALTQLEANLPVSLVLDHQLPPGWRDDMIEAIETRMDPYGDQYFRD